MPEIPKKIIILSGWLKQQDLIALLPAWSIKFEKSPLMPSTCVFADKLLQRCSYTQRPKAKLSILTSDGWKMMKYKHHLNYETTQRSPSFHLYSKDSRLFHSNNCDRRAWCGLLWRLWRVLWGGLCQFWLFPLNKFCACLEPKTLEAFT